MPTRLLLDGPDIEKLLDQVRTDYGQHAQIVQAERVRSGGFAGFFSKERFEVTVEIDDAYTAIPASTGINYPAGEQDQPLALLIAEAMNQVGGDSAGPLDSVRPSARPIVPVKPAPGLIDPELTLSTARPGFAEVLESVGRGLGQDPGVSDSSKKSSTKKQSAMVTAYGSTMADAAPIAVSTTEVAPMVTPTFEPVTIEPVTFAASTALAEIEYSAKRRPVRTQQLLIKEDLSVEPPKPPRGRGQVLALVGEAGEAFNAGIDLSRRMRIPQRRVILASPDQVIPGLIASRRLTDSVTARKRSLKLLAEPMPSVIAVDLPISAIWDEEAVDWASEMVGAIGAVQVWAVVDATRKYADLSRWLTKIGSVNALVVHNAAATEDLYPILDLGYPVAVLDNRPATSMVWNSMLRISGGQNS